MAGSEWMMKPYPGNYPFCQRRRDYVPARRRKNVPWASAAACAGSPVRSVAVALRRNELAVRARELAKQKLDIERLKLQQGLSSAFQVSRFEDDR